MLPKNRHRLLQNKTKPAPVETAKLPEFLETIEVYQGEVITKLAMKLIALTLVHTSELVGARWTELDRYARRWNVPAERMKGKKPHIVPLSAQAVDVLNLLETVTGKGEFLFPGDRNSTMRRIRFALKGVGITGTGFRGLGSTLLRQQGWPNDHIALQLALAPLTASGIATVPLAPYLGPRAKMMQAWADFLEKTQREASQFRAPR